LHFAGGLWKFRADCLSEKSAAASNSLQPRDLLQIGRAEHQLRMRDQLVTFSAGKFLPRKRDSTHQYHNIMKQRFLPILLGCSALLPIAPLQAAETTFGGFTAGQTFKMTVTERFTARVKGFKVTKNVAVPDSIPDFAVGDSVKFTIGTKGQLKGPGFVITYRRDNGRTNVYHNRPTLNSPDGDAAVVHKSLTDKPVRTALTFYDFRFSGIIPVVTTVSYELKK